MGIGLVTRMFGRSSNSQMVYRLALLLTLLALSDLPGFAQFGIPFPGGGYPGGGYPGQSGGGLPFPGRRRNSSQQPTDNVSGKIVSISTSQVVIDPGDNRNVTVILERNTQYRTDQGQGRYADFDIGDEVSIDAGRDNQNYYHAVRVNLIRKGSPGDTTDSRSSRDSSSDDPDRPKLKRAPSASGSGDSGTTAASSAAPDDPDRPKLKRAPSASGSGDSGAAAASSTVPDDPDRPRLKRATPASADSNDSPAPRPQPRAEIAASDDDQPTTRRRRAVATDSDGLKPVPRESDDPGPPVLRRGSARVDRTPPAGADSDTVASSARPSIKAEDANGVTRLPPPVVVGPPETRAYSDDSVAPARLSTAGQGTGDPVILAAREAAFNFTESLPNYVVKQYTTRYATDVARGNHTSWQALDVVTADVVSEGGKESYKNILVNGKPPRDSIEKTGSWSTGEFVTILMNLLAPQTDADFHNKRSTTIVNRAAFKYDFSVEQANSNWQITASSDSYRPAYTGTIWIDKENSRVLRIEMSAKNMPRAFPLDTVESALDYDYVMISEQKFLLPAHSETLSCTRGSSDCSRNVIEFRNYRKFNSDSTIRFDTDK